MAAVPDPVDDSPSAALGATSRSGRDALIHLIETLPDQAVLLLDPQGFVRTWNQGAENLKGYRAEEAIGLHFSTFYPPEANAVDHPERELEIASAMGRFEEEGWRVRKDGSRFFAHVVITALYDDEGEVIGFGKVTNDLTERKQAEEQQANTLKLLQATARTDSLTGLANRRAWDEAIGRELARARRTESPLCVAVIDIDYFKAINDEQGHGVGDRFLKRCAFAWSRALRGSDLLARWGGEEFAACLPDCQLDEAVVVVERMRSLTPDGRTCSAGVAQWNAREPAEALLGRADRAMYQAKEAGRDRTAVARAIRPV